MHFGPFERVSGTLEGCAAGSARVAGIRRGALLLLRDAPNAPGRLDRWTIDREGPATRADSVVLPVGDVQQAVVAGDLVVTLRAGNGVVEAWDLDHVDAPRWSVRVRRDRQVALVAAGGRLFVVRGSRELIELDPTTGAGRPTALGGDGGGRVALPPRPGRIGVGLGAGRILWIEPDGAVLDQQASLDTGQGPAAIGVSASGAVLFGASTEGLYTVRRGRSEPLELPLRGAVRIEAHPTEDRFLVCRSRGPAAIVDLGGSGAASEQIPGVYAQDARWVGDDRFVFVEAVGDAHYVGCRTAGSREREAVRLGAHLDGVPAPEGGWLLVDRRRLVRCDFEAGTCDPRASQPPLWEPRAVARADAVVVGGWSGVFAAEPDGSWTEVLPPVETLLEDGEDVSDVVLRDGALEAHVQDRWQGACRLAISEDGTILVVGRRAHTSGRMWVERWSRETAAGPWSSGRRLSPEAVLDLHEVALSACGSVGIVPVRDGWAAVLRDDELLAELAVGGTLRATVHGGLAVASGADVLAVVVVDTGEVRRAPAVVRGGRVRILDRDHLVAVGTRRLAVHRVADLSVVAVVELDLPGRTTWLELERSPLRVLLGRSWGTIHRAAIRSGPEDEDVEGANAPSPGP